MDACFARRRRLVPWSDEQTLAGRDGRRSKDAGQEDAQRPADPVHGPDVERVVDLEALAQEDRPVADGSGDETDEDGRARIHET